MVVASKVSVLAYGTFSMHFSSRTSQVLAVIRCYTELPIIVYLSVSENASALNFGARIPNILHFS